MTVGVKRTAMMPHSHLGIVLWLTALGVIDAMVALRSEPTYFWLALAAYAVLSGVLALGLRARHRGPRLIGRAILILAGLALLGFGAGVALYAIDPIALIASVPPGIAAVVLAVWPFRRPVQLPR